MANLAIMVTGCEQYYNDGQAKLLNFKIVEGEVFSCWNS